MPNVYPTISEILRTTASPIDGYGVIGVSITKSAQNYYNIIGNNLDQLSSVYWSPVNLSSIKFKMVPIQLYSSNMARFGIIILDNYCNAEDRSGKIGFRLKDNTSLMQWQVITYGNLGITYQGSLSGRWESET